MRNILTEAVRDLRLASSGIDRRTGRPFAEAETQAWMDRIASEPMPEISAADAGKFRQAVQAKVRSFLRGI